MKRKEKGLSLIEAAMVLALAAIVISGAMVYYTSARNNYELNSAVEMISSIQQRVAALYQNNPTVDSDLSLSMLHLSGIKTLPEDPDTGVLPGGIHFNVQHDWWDHAMGEGNGDIFYIILKNITVEQCVVLSDKKNGTTGLFDGALIAADNGYTDISAMTLEKRTDYCDKYREKASGKPTVGLIFSVHGRGRTKK